MWSPLLSLSVLNILKHSSRKSEQNIWNGNQILTITHFSYATRNSLSWVVSSHLESCFVVWSSHQRFLQERLYLFILSQFICLVGLHLGGALTQELLELSRENRLLQLIPIQHHPSWRTMSLCSRLHWFKPSICWTIIFLSIWIYYN